MANTLDIGTFRKLVDRTVVEYIDDEFVRNLRMGAFRGCTSLTRVNLPNLVVLDGGYEFYGCTSLEEICLPKVTSLETIIGHSYDGRAFQNCTALKTIKLPKVTNMHESTFYNCDAIEVMYIGTETTRVASWNGQEHLPNTLQAIYVPDDLVASYKADSNWSRVATFILPYSSSPDA